MTILPITSENRQAALALQPAPSQTGFIESVEQCLVEADQLPLWCPVGLYDGALVGFAMYGFWENEGQCGRLWLDRLLVDQFYQGKGYGKGFLWLLLARMQKEYPCGQVFLSVYPTNAVATALYKKLGFTFNGELDSGGEQIMVKDF